MKEASLISIIIPTYNRAHLIGETLESILVQTYENWECIIVDDGSIDNTKKVIENFLKNEPRFQYFKRSSNLQKGVNACRNYGFEKSKGQYIQWFDSDDIMHPEKLQKQIELMSAHNLNCVFSNFSYFRGNFNDLRITNSFRPFNSFNEENLLTDYISGNIFLNFPNMMCKKPLLNEMPLNTEISYAEDIEFIFRMLTSNKVNVGICNDVLMFVRKHNNSLTDTFKKRSKKLINDEIWVRQFILNTVIEKKLGKELVIGGSKMYLKALKHLLYISEYKVFLNKMTWVFSNVNLKLKWLVVKLNILALFYIFTKKGITAYQKMLNKL